MLWLWITLSIVALLLIVTFAVTFWIFRITFWNEYKNVDLSRVVMSGEQYDPYHDKMTDLIEKAHQIPVSEEIRIPAHDGGTLYAKYFHVSDTAPVCILFHGYKGEGLRDFSGGINLVLKNGFNAILVDERGHARSKGRIISFGIRERYDVASWVSYVSGRFGKDRPIFLFGISMGAATVLMASDLRLDGNVKGILADCPYARPVDIIMHTASGMGIPTKGMKPFLLLSALLFGHFRLTASDAVRSVAKSNYPILIIHGDDDLFVPAAMSEEIQKANPDMVRRFTVPTAAHGMSYIVNPGLYREVTDRFLRDCLGSDRPSQR